MALPHTGPPNRSFSFGTFSRQRASWFCKNVSNAILLQLLKNSGNTCLWENSEKKMTVKTRSSNTCELCLLVLKCVFKIFSYPMLSPMTQVWPGCVFGQSQLAVSCDMPKLWPISCAIVEAIPRGLSLWS